MCTYKMELDMLQDRKQRSHEPNLFQRSIDSCEEAGALRAELGLIVKEARESAAERREKSPEQRRPA